jgi:hypothetical protein
METRSFERQTAKLKRIVFSLDGKLVAAGGTNVRIWDVTTCRLLHVLDTSALEILPLFFTSEKKLVINESRENDGFELRRSKLWNPRSDRDWRFLPYSMWHVRGQSENGCLLAVDAFARLGATEIRQWPSFKRICLLKTGRVTAAAFSSDGKYCVTGESGGNLIVWDLVAAQKRLESRPLQLTAEQSANLWSELGTRLDYEQVVDLLVENPDTTVPFLKERLRAVSCGDATKLIAQLDSSSYLTRRQAFDDLLDLEFGAYHSLRLALKGKLSTEARVRVEEVLQALDDPNRHKPEWCRRWNSIVVLEQIASPEAFRVLESLAEGAPQARLTKEAAAALDRIKSVGPKGGGESGTGRR